MSQANTNKGSNIQYHWLASIAATDKPAIAELIRKVSATDPIVGFSDKVTTEEINSYLDKLQENVEAGRCYLMVGKADNNDMVCMVVLVQHGSPNNCHIADMSKGMISHEYRGSGVLMAAFASIVGKCREHGIEVLTLDVRAGTPAQQIWLKCGFEDYGVLDDYARVDGQVIAGHYMKQTVNDLAAKLGQ